MKKERKLNRFKVSILTAVYTTTHITYPRNIIQRTALSKWCWCYWIYGKWYAKKNSKRKLNIQFFGWICVNICACKIFIFHLTCLTSAKKKRKKIAIAIESFGKWKGEMLVNKIACKSNARFLYFYVTIIQIDWHILKSA